MVATTDGTSAAPHVLDRLLAIEHIDDDKRWLLLDVDHYLQSTHTPSFLEAMRRAKSLGVKVALSKPSFELWLLLHHVEPPEVTALVDARELEDKLRLALGSYYKTRLNKADFPLSSVAKAHARGRALDTQPPWKYLRLIRAECISCGTRLWPVPCSHSSLPNSLYSGIRIREFHCSRSSESSVRVRSRRISRGRNAGLGVRSTGRTRGSSNTHETQIRVGPTPSD